MASGTAVVVGCPGSGRTALLRGLGAGEPAGRLVAGLRTAAGVPLLVCSWAAGRSLVRLGGLTSAGVAAALAEALPGPLLVDDADDADPASAEALVALAGVLPLVVAVRAGESGSFLVDRLSAQGAVIVTAGPLEPGDAEAVAAGLGASDPSGVARRSGGVPGLLVALAGGVDPSERHLAAVDAHVRRLSEPAALDLAVAGLVAHELPLGELPAGAELEAEALLARRAGSWWLRHGLAAEQALVRSGELGQNVHARAARLTRDPARAVELLEAAGDRAGAAVTARAGAAAETDPALRARLWGLVASVTGDLTAELEAATAAVRAADGPRAAQHAAAAPAGAWSALRAVQAARLIGDEAAAIGGLDLVGNQVGGVDGLSSLAGEVGALTSTSGSGGDGPALAAEVGVETARLRVPIAWGPLEVPAVGAGAGGALVEALAAALAGNPAVPALAAAVTAAEEELDRDLELAARAALAVTLAAGGDASGSLAAAATLVRRAEETGARSWQEAPGRLAAALQVHLTGDPWPLLDLGAGGNRFGPPVTAHLAVALADVGRTGEAAALIESTSWPETPVAQALRWWSAAEAAYGGGRLRTALVAAAECAAVAPPGFPAEVGAALVGARAAVESAQPLPMPERRWTPQGPRARIWRPMGADAELEALRLEAGGDTAAAAAGFDTAAVAWAGGNRRAELRCRWSAADLLLRAGSAEHRDGALEALLTLDAAAADLGLRPLAARVRRTLRAAGVRLTAGETERERRGPLSGRETEVLRLVGAGRSSAEIAAHLGVATSTVETQIKSAIRKLGATNRRHAAALMAEADRA